MLFLGDGQWLTRSQVHPLPGAVHEPGRGCSSELGGGRLTGCAAVPVVRTGLAGSGIWGVCRAAVMPRAPTGIQPGGIVSGVR